MNWDWMSEEMRRDLTICPPVFIDSDGIWYWIVPQPDDFVGPITAVKEVTCCPS